ncbi:GNAT family N-acetyltransferase [Dehalogenimonas etheniformans]|uniref:N-acetyltransferase n=1 Tax=Dehalogenimonas etheniformans TaxID=1536648 RepID=A0A2P5P6F5_9CHLR|nr:GNAT family N-acetyltransferase [Dehalogenimonas etheniformans]PPD57867.1 N-acetyltransferase [Dehalogenimonas etheniformans]QNT75480.1 GNAT family N-acetyltransferase [Dehalogenimonas etheniformans]
MEDTELTDGLITLRPLRMSDALEVMLAVQETMDSLRLWMPWAHPAYSIAESEGWIKNALKSRPEGTAYEFAITDARDGAFIGGCGLNHINTIDKVANLGYWVRSSRQRHGAASRAAKLLIKFGIDELKFNRIEILAAVENTASRRTAEKAGAVREAIMRHRLLLPDKVHDSFLFSIIPADIA